MPAAVLDLNVEKLPSEIEGLDGYERAFVLIRLRGCPVGKAWIPVAEGRIRREDFWEHLVRGAGWRLWDQWLRDYLEWDKFVSPPFNPGKATVAICTRDRPEDLRRCLEAVTRFTEEGHEILVVDNCPSRDATRQVVEGYRNIRYVREAQPGLNRARNRALREAKNEVVAFTDDDAVPDPGWLHHLLRNFSDPLALCVTGLTVPLELETEAQEWFERHISFGRGFWRIVYDRMNRNPMAAGRVGAGANMALRRNTLDRVGPFDEALDGGTPTLSGGDTEMFSRILARGYRIVYEPAAVCWHRHRRTWKDLRKTVYGYGVGVYAFWTRSLLVEGEWGVLKEAFFWFLFWQLRSVARSLLGRPNSVPLDLLLAELRGCAHGPWAYLSSRRRLQSRETAPSS